MNYCSDCGSKVAFHLPPGDDRPRYRCTNCGIIHYQNPLMVVGCIPEWGDRILLCRRAIEPRHGLWTLPAGYLENEETVEDGARRELMEEACAVAFELKPYGLYSIPHVSQVYLMFRTRLKEKTYDAGEESLEVRLFALADIPWDELAFPVIEKTLKRYCNDGPNGTFPFHIDSISKTL